MLSWQSRMEQCHTVRVVNDHGLADHRTLDISLVE